ncbi:hypothetical protein [Glycomyces sp. NPDC047010]|uniref:hypothetical protein n=1 Tax=Glycomyces sp. NPDC047010 TaxID=3155023 RepID=UPI0033DA8029
MGSPAQMTLNFPGEKSTHFYLHWGSPHYQIPNMAAFVFETWSNGLAWSLDGYRSYVEALNIQDLPTEDGPARKDAHKWGVEHSYTYTFTADGQVSFSYAHRPIGGDGFASVDGGAARLDLYQAALRWRRELRTNVYGRFLRSGERSSIEDYDLALLECEFRIASESRPGVTESISSRTYHRNHQCIDAGCGRPITLDPADQS